MICLNKYDLPEDDLEVHKSVVGLFSTVSEGLQNCDIPDPDIILLIHKWVMKGLEQSILTLDLDPVEAMKGKTPLGLISKSDTNWIIIDIIFRNKVYQRLHLKFST